MTTCGLAQARASGQFLRPRPTRTSMRQSHPHVPPTQHATEKRLGRLIGSPALLLPTPYLYRSILPSFCLSFFPTLLIVRACSPCFCCPLSYHMLIFQSVSCLVIVLLLISILVFLSVHSFFSLWLFTCVFVCLPVRLYGRSGRSLGLSVCLPASLSDWHNIRCCCFLSV